MRAARDVAPAVRGPAPQRWAEIDLDAIRRNVRELCRRLPAGCRLIAVVKADGYGHGAAAVARAVLEAGAWGLGVSTPEEALPLRALCDAERLLVMGGLAPSRCDAAAAAACRRPGCRSTSRSTPGWAASAAHPRRRPGWRGASRAPAASGWPAR